MTLEELQKDRRGFKEMKLTNYGTVLLSDEDYEKISAYKWYNTGKRSNSHYAMRNLRGTGKHTVMYMHREILNAPKGSVVDHINGNGLDNRRENLRFVSTSGNMRNQARHRADPLCLGTAYIKKQNKWRACYRAEGKTMGLGQYKTKEEAHNIWLIADQMFNLGYRLAYEIGAADVGNTCVAHEKEFRKEGFRSGLERAKELAKAVQGDPFVDSEEKLDGYAYSKAALLSAIDDEITKNV